MAGKKRTAARPMKASGGARAGEVKRTSVALPLEVWKRAQHLAVDDGRDLQDIVLDALQDYLSKRGA